MRSTIALSLSSILLLSGLIACTQNEGETDENANDQTQDVTGGSKAIESPVVYLFEGADKNLAPKCAGALIADKIAVTVKSCAKVGLIIGRAADDDGKGSTRATVTAVHVPPGADADIAVVELDKAVGGTPAVITHTPLRDGYAVNGVAAADERGFFSPLSPNKGQASSIEGKLISETELHASIVPAKGSTICATDIGAPVCSSTGTRIPVLNVNILGTCGLSGLVIGQEAAAPATTTTPPSTAPKAAGEAPPPAAPAAAGCNANAWKVVELGRYADFLRGYAPKAFQPIVIDKPIIRNFPSAPDGLWGYKSKGEIKSCKIETAKLDPTAANGEAKVTAKAFFTNMEERARAYGRFGIAPKNAPEKMRWLPAKTATEKNGNNFEASFEGVVSAAVDGDYIVAFRASANGGEVWTKCDLDGIENGYSADKALELKVGNAPATNDPAKTQPQDAPASPTGDSNSTDYTDPPPSSDTSADDYSSDSPSGAESDPTEAPAKKKKADSGGCSAASGSTSTTSLPIAGLLLGLAAFIRRRRSA